MSMDSLYKINLILLYLRFLFIIIYIISNFENIKTQLLCKNQIFKFLLLKHLNSSIIMTAIGGNMRNCLIMHFAIAICGNVNNE
jgi:hypothetical protein